MKIKQDTREPELQLLADLNEMSIEFVREFMKVGDYEFNNVIVERKEIDDFCNSILDKRIENQVKNMKQSGKVCFIIIVGNMKDRKVDIHENCLLGKMVSLIIKHNIKILWCEDEFQFLYLLKNVYEKTNEMSKV